MEKSKTTNNQLPYVETRTWRTLWRKLSLEVPTKTGNVLVKKYKRSFARGLFVTVVVLSNAYKSSSWTYGTHRVESSYLVFQGFQSRMGLTLDMSPRALPGASTLLLTWWSIQKDAPLGTNLSTVNTVDLREYGQGSFVAKWVPKLSKTS